MHALSLSPRQGWPLVTGARLREYYLLKALGLRARLTHVFFRHPDDPAPGPDDFPFCETIVPVAPPRRYTIFKVLRGLFGRCPLPVVNYTSPEMQAAISSLLAGSSFDFAHIESIHMAGYLSLLPPGMPVFFDWHNIESELMARYAASAPTRPRAAYASFTARKLASLERRILREASGHIVCSPRECEELRRLAPGARVAVVENGVDVEYFASDGKPAGERFRVLFVGSMGYHANSDAAVSFARDHWPAVRERFPGWKFTIVGSNPAPAVLGLHEQPGVEVTGAVPDLRPYYREAVASVVPLTVGGGTRLKILESMAAGVPVVSTEIGAEGLSVTPGTDILFASSHEDWLACLSTLAARRDLCASIVRAARDLVRARYDWSLVGESLNQTYAGWLER